ncbi:MAG: pyridoxal-phosphate dependent enzyme [Thermomicrobiales bacterium]
MALPRAARRLHARRDRHQARRARQPLRRPAPDRLCGRLPAWPKHEGENPTGSFKDRGMTVGMTHARRLGTRTVACASSGNTSASLAAYAATAGLQALTFVPEGKVSVAKIAQTTAYGAKVIQVRGDFDAAMRLVQEVAETPSTASTCSTRSTPSASKGRRRSCSTPSRRSIGRCPT